MRMKKEFKVVLTSDSEGNKDHNAVRIDDERTGKGMVGFIYDIHEDRGEKWIQWTIYTSLGFDISFNSELEEKSDK